ncbi:hypothetical protein H6G68_14590 [Anabaena catenula FACHB-362]|uniref:Uncharacterized protein n=1 Tax=Anabaena catenula FACHB-362 TaxID=2692877 RepID=A0ABR8J468_9NOST|nr:hypothetical protein [Anabaena catenula FACHB-362]
MTKSAAHDVEEIQTGICILHGVEHLKHYAIPKSLVDSKGLKIDLHIGGDSFEGLCEKYGKNTN